MQEQKKVTFSDLDYLVDFDDRVCCNGCPMADTSTDEEFIASDRADAIKSSGKELGFAGDKIERRGKWVVLSWAYGTCSVDDAPLMPSGLLHRCQHIKPAGYEVIHPEKKTPQKADKRLVEASEESSNWWD